MMYNSQVLESDYFIPFFGGDLGLHAEWPRSPAGPPIEYAPQVFDSAVGIL